MVTQEEISRAVELDAIRTDALFVCRVGMSFERNQGNHGIAAAFGIYNYMSLFVYESRRYLSQYQPAIASQLVKPNDEDLARSRHSAKLFDDTKKGVDGVVGYSVNSVAAAHSKRFLGNTWMPLARPLETDLGLYIYDGRVVATTHGVTFGIGIEPDKFVAAGGEILVGDTSVVYGQYFAAFCDRSEVLDMSFVDKLEAGRLKTKDVRSAGYYRKHFNGPATPGINGMLTVFSASLNFLDSMLALDDLPQSRQTVLKMQFITLYHVVSSLRILRAERGAELTKRSKGFMNQMIDDPGLEVLTEGSAKKFRNILVHYGLDRTVKIDDLRADAPFYGLIEKYFPGYDYDRLSAATAGQVRRIARIFNEWL